MATTQLLHKPKEQSPREVLQRLQDWVKENPTRKRKVIPIEIRVESDTQEGVEAPAAGVGGLVPTPLEPPGPVSLWLWKTNPEFRAGTAQVRRTILREAILTFTERVERELRGSRWCRKKVLEQLAAQQTAAVSPPMETPELDRALAYLCGVQKVVVDEAGKKVTFFPVDPRTWSAETPVWCGTTGARAVLHRQGEESVIVDLGRWLGARESEGWRVDWPEAEGTMEELKTEMQRLGVGVGGGIGKPKKADLAAALGRAQALRHLGEISAGAGAAN